VELRYI